MPDRVAPIACSLGGHEMQARQTRWQAPADTRLIAHSRVKNGAGQIYQRDSESERQPTELVALEAECCPFLSFDLSRGEEELVLEVHGREETAGIIDRSGPAFSRPRARAVALGVACA